MPETGKQLSAEDACAVVESVKAASDVYSPLGGKVTEVNEALGDAPESINDDPYGDGWIFKLALDSRDELQGLMDAAGYEKFLEEEEA